MVRSRAGPTWSSGSVREQPDWDAHAEFVDALIERGTFVMGGPFSDNSGSMSLLEGIDADEARRILEGDPFMKNGVFVLEEIREWTVFVDELSTSG
ncbi:MAG TPA: YciI family protein [Gaiellaceae bacterium]